MSKKIKTTRRLQELAAELMTVNGSVLKSLIIENIILWNYVNLILSVH